ncbi:heme biosynthesis protein HemY [Prosthecomicrobium pneumaticum]|uniref:HemY protein n=1 Tax=Prosthecomicrobium pneumaticum TaxID=81895 RepID=A0A7W9FN83_9HYPH|nr:heme biosynthesis HemY N-terminal domain-containing protein [Prosthecomicrobium pneumaticum]MBB5753764.1 HemY protein [Prosthecomicrobium pneumaticum]
MLRLLATLAIVFVAAAGFAWLADNPGDVTLVWQGREFRTTLMVAAVALAALFVALALLWALVSGIFRTPRLIGRFFSGRKRDRGYRALSRGMIAVGAGDTRLARRLSVEARRILGEEPLALLLAAQSAQLAGDTAGARAAFEAMRADPETRLLGLHGLFVEAQRRGEHEAARQFAEEAAALAPTLRWAGTALFDYRAAAGDWRGALLTLATNLNAKLIDRQRAHRYRAVLLTAQGLAAEQGGPSEAKALALDAVRLAPDLVPAATLAARILTRLGETRRAARILEAAWRRGPHPELADAYAELRPGDAARDRRKRMEKLAALVPGHVEGRLALARAALEERDFGEARRLATEVAREAPSERVFLLLADIEEEAGDLGRARELLGRAVRAPRDPAWIADGIAAARWAPISPVTGRLDAFEWKAPAALIGAPEPLDLATGAEPAALEAPAVAEPADTVARAAEPALPARPPSAPTQPAPRTAAALAAPQIAARPVQPDATAPVTPPIRPATRTAASAEAEPAAAPAVRPAASASLAAAADGGAAASTPIPAPAAKPAVAAVPASPATAPVVPRVEGAKPSAARRRKDEVMPPPPPDDPGPEGDLVEPRPGIDRLHLV